MALPPNFSVLSLCNRIGHHEGHGGLGLNMKKSAQIAYLSALDSAGKGTLPAFWLRGH